MWRAIEEHHRTFRKSYEQLFRIAAKGVAAKAVRLTPPFRWAKNAKDTESDKIARQRGIAAVQIGVLKLFTTSVETARKNGFQGPLSRQIIVQNSAHSLMRQYHQQNRNRLGRVPTQHKAIKVVTKSALRSYLVKSKKGVGYLASGWIQGAQIIQASLPSWIKKHNGPGSAILEIKKDRLYFRMTNAVEFSSKMSLLANRIPVAIRLQAFAMLRQIAFKTQKRVII